jgi:hypothetical protein
MPNHAYVRLSGYAVTIVPLAPLHVHRSPKRDRAVILTHPSPTGMKHASLSVAHAAHGTELAP